MTFNELAAEIAKNNSGEEQAIEGYFRLLSINNLPKEFIADIEEIISDEMHHAKVLSEWASRLSGIQPNAT